MWVGRTATEIARAVREGRATAEEVVSEHLDHLEAVEPRIGAYELVMRDDALAAARELDARGDVAELALAGVPVAIKDVVDVRGTPTRKGSVAVPETPAEKDDLLVANLRRAGAIVVGKTRCPELCFAAMSDNGSGVARNPWNLGRSAGGSSGGSAAALAAGTVPIALGSDGGGSIRLPAAACGLVGLKPGDDTVHRGDLGPPANWYGMSSPGPMATTVEDLALMLAVLTGDEQRGRIEPLPTNLRVAVSDRGSLPLPPRRDVRRVWTTVVDVLEADGHRIDRTGPAYPRWLSPAIAQRSFQGAAFEAECLGMDLSRAGKRTRQVVTRGRRLAAKGAPDPERAQRWKSMADAFFADHDVLVTPATGSPAPRLRDYHNSSFLRGLPAQARFALFTSPWNLAELPAASVPAGFTDDGLPIGVQIVAGRGREDLVLAVARRLEQVRPWPRHASNWLPVGTQRVND